MMKNKPTENKTEENKIPIKVYGRIIEFAKMHPKMLVGMIASMTLVALIDVMFPLLTSYAIDNFITPASAAGLEYFVALFSVLVVTMGLMTRSFIIWAGKLEMSISYDIRKQAFSKLQRLSFSYYDNTSVGYLMARMISDITRLSEMVAWSIVDILWSVVFIAGAVTTMLILQPVLALQVLSVALPLAVVSVVFERAILRRQRTVRKLNSAITASFNECIAGALTTKTLTRESDNYREFDELTLKMRRASMHSATLSAVFIPLVVFIGTVGTAIAISRGGAMVYSGAIALGTLAAFISYSMQMFDPIQSIARVVSEFQSAKASAERVITLLDEPETIRDSAAVEAQFGTVFEPKTENWPAIHGDVEFKNVSFWYKPDEPILTDFYLKVSTGQNIAIVGETGAGKSTIVNLICRFYEPTAGSILIDGTDYRQRSQLWLERQIGYVLQTPHLFSGTVAENIAYAAPDADAGRIEKAARTVGAHEFISGLEKGYDTQVGEGGGLLSTGQKQLISFARAIIADPRIFVLDEATASIDTETERIIQTAITKVLENRTSFIIAHRLSTIENADRILVIDGGRIVEQGTHSELLALKGRYYELYTAQLRDMRQRTLLDSETE